jgi:hypothetical protein
MVKKYSIIVVFTLVSLCSSCQRCKVMKVGKETVLKQPNFKLDYILDEKGMQVIDISSVYVYQGEYLKFFVNGEVIRGNKYDFPVMVLIKQLVVCL